MNGALGTGPILQGLGGFGGGSPFGGPMGYGQRRQPMLGKSFGGMAQPTPEEPQGPQGPPMLGMAQPPVPGLPVPLGLTARPPGLPPGLGLPPGFSPDMLSQLFGGNIA